MSIDDPIWSECDIPLTDIAPHDYDLSLASSLDEIIAGTVEESNLSENEHDEDLEASTVNAVRKFATTHRRAFATFCQVQPASHQLQMAFQLLGDNWPAIRAVLEANGHRPDEVVRMRTKFEKLCAVREYTLRQLRKSHSLKTRASKPMSAVTTATNTNNSDIDQAPDNALTKMISSDEFWLSS